MEFSNFTGSTGFIFLILLILGLLYLGYYLLTIHVIAPWYQKNRPEGDPARSIWVLKRDKLLQKHLVSKMAYVCLFAAMMILLDLYNTATTSH